MRKRKACAAVVAVVLASVMVLLAEGCKDTRTAPITIGDEEMEKAPKKTHMLDKDIDVDESTSIGDLEFTVNSYKWAEGDYQLADPSKLFVVLDLEVRNNSGSESAQVFPMMQMMLKTVEYMPETPSPFYQPEPKFPDIFVLEPGESEKGTLAYELPEDYGGALSFYVVMSKTKRSGKVKLQ